MRSLAFLLLIGALLGYGYTKKETILAHLLSKQLCCDLSIKHAKITPNQLLLKGVTIKNPQGSHLPYALEKATVQVDANLIDFLKGIVPIRCITLKNATLKLEFKDANESDNNWAKLLRSFSQREGGKGYVIDSLVISNIHFNGVCIANKRVNPPTLAHLELEQLGRPRPLAVGQLSRIVFQSILSTLTTKPQLSKLLDHVALVPSSATYKIQPTTSKTDTQALERAEAEMLRRRKLYL